MADFFESWLERAFVSPGVLACGVRNLDGAISVKSGHDGIPDARVQEVLHNLSGMARMLQQNQIVTERLRWTLEVGQLHCACRPDNSLSMLITSYDPGALPDIDQLITDFLRGDPLGG